AESFASRNTPIDSIFDGIGMGLGFTLGLTTLGLIRELLGSGSIFGYKFIGDADGMLVFVLAPGAFIVLGYLIALVNRLKSK
ncbi:MAG: Rnf-Nqr domain containing protein, partial [Bacteroidales bacterium]|nr:Rnf-Nqr domain containing protein [Bacteroidales bacterium]